MSGFSGVIGQKNAVQFLRDSLKGERLPHALLLLGKPGFGSLPLALALARHVMCTNPTTEDSCGSCSACSQMDRLVHPDMHWVFPVVPKGAAGKPTLSRDYLPEWRQFVPQNPYVGAFDWLQAIKAENRQGNITASECREIIRQLNLKSVMGGWKVQLIWMADYLQEEGNILLKLIEEPPEKTLIILIAEEEERMLNTILSRTQSVRLQRLADEEVKTYLIAREQADEVLAGRIASLAEGDLEVAIRLKSDAFHDELDLFKELVRVAAKRNVSGASEWVQQMASRGRERQKNFVIYATHLLRRSLMGWADAGALIQASEDERPVIDYLSRNLGAEQFGMVAAEWEQSVLHIERNANPRLTFHCMALVLERALHKQPIPEPQKLLV